MAGGSVYVVMADGEINSIYSTLAAANSGAEELSAEDGQKPDSTKKRKDGSLEITGETKIVVDIWPLQQVAPSKRTTSTKKTAEAKPKKTTAAAKPSNATGPTVETPVGSKDALSGKVVCVTGTIEGYTRTQIQTVIQEHGGSTVSSITKAVNLVVLGIDAGQKKLDAIEKNGIETVDYDGLTGMIEASSGGASKKRRHG
ncbi:hypothetical protein EJ05DRAFT_475703 [Pseudovirgaria hyperparasitica]|uniref:BRCT domain-containing protein n=1 Tax=Pseudovirgaria hyperparasitica TaxID=470096 RepID=A0A6A6W847_9PEZI|nr:uncharacterized protein EJ05DRAFT_475703 [Pseudovirgaria hyperparasitica]KAF2758379.1 hypothetical protein EJ05DRAFT_475703 [Pseudovirgaria hyperparasitica]